MRGNSPNKFRLGQLVQTKSGLVGKVIGYAEYFNGWEYRVKVDGKPKTMYRKEAELKVPSEKKKRERKK
jgi:preprotein translocase subunit YajC